MYSKIIIIGNLGRDPELKFTADGKAVANCGWKMKVEVK